MHFYVVIEGQVNLVLYSKAGEEKIVDILGPGQSFAEAVMFMAGPVYPVSAVAAIAVADRAVFQHRIRRDAARKPGDLPAHARTPEPAPAHAHPRDRVPDARERHPPAGAHDREPACRPDTDGPAEIQLQESRQEIASRLSMKPETLSRILRTLSDSGAIVVHGRTLQVPSRARLLSFLDTAA